MMARSVDISKVPGRTFCGCVSGWNVECKKEMWPTYVEAFDPVFAG